MHAHDGYALAYANVDLYGHAPWLFGFGGTIIDDDGKLAIATPEAAAAMAFARDARRRARRARATRRRRSSRRCSTRARPRPRCRGPWFVADIAPGVPWKVATLPIVSATGKPAAPFVGAEGILMSARAHDKDAAFAVMDFLTGDAAAIERAQLARQVVPNRARVRRSRGRGDPVLAAFRAQLEHTVPMPKAPAMRMVWTPYAPRSARCCPAAPSRRRSCSRSRTRSQGYAGAR